MGGGGGAQTSTPSLATIPSSRAGGGGGGGGGVKSRFGDGVGGRGSGVPLPRAPRANTVAGFGTGPVRVLRPSSRASAPTSVKEEDDDETI
jgi:hypothetical protein